MAAMRERSEHPTEQDEDSDWEYEYHETETETFYVTLDLPSASATDSPEKKPQTPAAPAVPLQPTESARATDQASQSTQTPPNPEATPKPLSELQREPFDPIQILDFHTRNPLISYQKQIYTCTWTSTIGTDLLLTTPDPTSTIPRLKESKGFDVLATTNIKLIAKPAQLIPRTGPGISRPTSLTPDGETSETNPAPEASNATGENLEQAASDATRIDLGPNPSQAQQNQAHFLSRLMAAKAKRGETDSVPVHSKRVYSGVGWRAQQREKATARVGAQQEGGEEVGEGGSELVLQEVDCNGEVVLGPSARSRGAQPRTRRLRGRGRIRAVGRRGDTASSITGRVRGGLVAGTGAGGGTVQSRESQDGGVTGRSIATPRAWNELARGEKGAAGATVIAPPADTDMAGVDGDARGEPSPIDATATASTADSGSGPSVESSDTRKGPGSAAEAVLDTPDIDIPMEDAP